MFDQLSTPQRNQHVEVCRYFFRANLMKKHLEALVWEYGSMNEAVTSEWDEFWAYYCYWLSGLWIVCEGIDRIKFGEPEFIAFAKSSMSKLHPVRQATFHFKPNTAQMMRHFAMEEAAFHEVLRIHDRISEQVGAFLESLTPEYLATLNDD